MMNTAQQTPVTDSTPTVPVSGSTTPPPPEAHQMTSQVPQSFALPTAAPVHSEVPTEPIPQMQPVVSQSFTPSTEPMAPTDATASPQLPPSSFVPPKKSFPLKAALAVIIMVLTLVGGGAAYYLSQNSQDLRQQAASDVYPTLPPTAPPGGGSACSQGLYDCGSLSSNPAGCSSNAGQGCYYHQASSTCKCGSNNGGGGGGTGPSASCSGGKAHICGGSTGATFCVASCSNGGNYSGSSCTSGCNSNCTDVSVSANTCQDVGPGTSSCGRWQVDVHGAASCADSGCSSSGCNGGGGGSTTPTATVSISQSSCIALPGKYQTGSAITFNGTGASTNARTTLQLAKVNAAGTGLDTSFNGNCPIGTTATGSPYWCVITANTTNSPTASWAPATPGKYVVVVNGYGTTEPACSGNPICSYNAGADNPMTPNTCAGSFVSCSNNDYIFFEVVPEAQCAGTTPTATVSISQSSCIALPGKYQTGSAITFNGSGAATNVKTALLIAKVNAAGTGLDTSFNGNCPIGTTATGSPYWCTITSNTTNSPTASWAPATPGKYVVVVNGYGTTEPACSGNPICSYNAGADNPMTPNTCAGSFVSCSNNDYIFFEVVPEAQCVTEVPTGPMCLSITAKRESGEALSVKDTLKIGDKVKFTCGTVPNVNTYGFRVIEDGVKSPIETVAGTTSKVYTITKPGQFVGQCTICPNGVCYPFTSTDP